MGLRGLRLLLRGCHLIKHTYNRNWVQIFQFLVVWCHSHFSCLAHGASDLGRAERCTERCGRVLNGEAPEILVCMHSILERLCSHT